MFALLAGAFSVIVKTDGCLQHYFCFRVADKWRKELGEAEAKEMEAVCRGAIRSHEELTMLA